ncbi:MAG: MFS transporter [Methanomicrobiales archaeon]|nr:MFS transporter [Methanomicrobiales archaeon]
MTFSTPEIASRTLKKVSWRLLPFLFVLYVVAYLDRVNFGYAALQMNSDLGLTAEMFGFLSGIFFIGYLLFEIPSNIILQRVGARVWIARIMITWGIVVIITAFATSATDLAVFRFVLGIAEAGFFPGLILYLTAWFREQDLAQAVALFMAALAVSNIIGAPVSTWILDNIAWCGMAGWRWLFILEGIPAVILGIATWLYLTDTPAGARWLEDEEKAYLAGVLVQEHEHRVQNGAGSSLMCAMASRNVWHLAIVYCTIVIGLYGTGFWMPQIIRSLDPAFTNFEIGVLMVIPFLAALICMILWSRHSDHTGERRWHTALPPLAGGIALVGAGLTDNPAVAFILLVIATGGIFCSFGPFWTLPAALFTGSAAAVGIALINSVGNLGGFIGPTLMGYLTAATGSLQAGLIAVGICLALAGILAALVPGRVHKNR